MDNDNIPGAFSTLDGQRKNRCSVPSGIPYFPQGPSVGLGPSLRRDKTHPPVNTVQRPRPHKIIYGYEDPRKNLVKNWSFEQPLDPDNWVMKDATGTRRRDSHTGGWCLHVHKREQPEGGAHLRILGLKKGTSYYFSYFMKLLNHPEGVTFFLTRLFIYIKLDSAVRPTRMRIGQFTFQRGPFEWQQFGGDFTTPHSGFSWIEFRIEIDALDVEYCLDTVSLIELEKDHRWRANMEKIIRRIRTSPIQLNVTLPRCTNPKQFQIQLRQTKRDFAFGAAINADIFNINEKYRKCFFKHFEWAVFTNHTKWMCMEGRKGRIRYDRVDKAMKFLTERGITVRGHTIHWNKMEGCPDWLHNLQPDQLQEEVDRRTKYVVEHFKGQFVHWDVLNEHLHGRYLDVRTGNHKQLSHICRMTHRLDPDCHLYINDYEVVRSGEQTSTQANLARTLLAEGVPIHGIGIQSHLRVTPVSMEIHKKRLDIVAAAGLPLMITELSIHNNDVNMRARALEEALYVYMSNPHVIGVIFWTFWDQSAMSEDMPLFEGDDLEPNEAGQKLKSLLRKWSTDITITPEGHKVMRRFPAFHGEYELDVMYKGNRIWRQSFKINKGQSMKLDLNIEPEDQAGQDPQVEYLEECRFDQYDPDEYTEDD